MLTPQILLVEHEQSVITQITAFIEKIGFCKPQVAGSQEEAKNIARYNRPDIALVDLALGNHNDGQTTAIMLSQITIYRSYTWLHGMMKMKEQE